MPHATRPPRYECLRGQVKDNVRQFGHKPDSLHTQSHEHEKIDKKSTGEHLTANGEPLRWPEDCSNYKQGPIGDESHNAGTSLDVSSYISGALQACFTPITKKQNQRVACDSKGFTHTHTHASHKGRHEETKV